MKKDKVGILGTHGCEFCGSLIDIGKTRCSDCDKVWQEGYRAGEENLAAEIRNLHKNLKQLIGGK